MKEKEVMKSGYKWTKLGWVPEEWEVVKFEKIISNGPQNGLYKPLDEYTINGTQIVRIDNFNDGKLDNEKPLKRVQLSKEEIDRYKLFPSDIVINRVNSITHVGKSALILDMKENTVFESNMMRISLNSKISSPKYINYILIYSGVLGRLRLRAKTAIAQVSLNQHDICSTIIPLPPLPEQQKIAAILSTWDKAIELTQQLIEVKEEQKKGLMQRLLTGNSNWKIYQYNDVLKQVKRTVEFDDETLYELISVRRRSGGLFHRDSLYGKEILTKDLRTAKEGDFLMSKMQILHGASGLTTKEFDGMKISGSYIAVVSKDTSKLDIKFFNCLSKVPYFYHQTYISSYGVHIEKMTFDFKTFLKLNLRLPTLTEQRKIVQILSIADEELRILKAKMDALKEQKKGLMQQLLTGKKRVKNFKI